VLALVVAGCCQLPLGLADAQGAPRNPAKQPGDAASNAASSSAEASVSKDDSIPRARVAFERAKKALADGDLAEAVRFFGYAYQFQPNYAVLYNLGQALSLMRRPVEARNAFEQYLREGGEKISAERREKVQQLLARQLAHIGFLQIRDTDEGVELFVDAEPAGTTPIPEPLALSEGKHSLLAKAEGFEPFVEVLALEPAQTLTVSVHLTKRSVPTVSRNRRPPPPPLLGPRRVPLSPKVIAPDTPPRRNRGPWLIASGATAAVLGATALGLFVWNEHRYDDWQRDRMALDARLAVAPDDTASRAARNDLYQRATSIQHVDDAALSAALLGGSALVTGVVLWLTR